MDLLTLVVDGGLRVQRVWAASFVRPTRQGSNARMGTHDQVAILSPGQSNRGEMTEARTPVVFIHGLWLHATSWQPCVDMFNGVVMRLPRRVARRPRH